MSDIETSSEPKVAAMVGIDWGDKKHAWALQVEGSSQIERGDDIEHAGQSLALSNIRHRRCAEISRASFVFYNFKVLNIYGKETRSR